MVDLIRTRCEPLDGSTCDRPAVEGLCVVHRAEYLAHVVPEVDRAEIEHLDDPDVPTFTD